MNVRVTFQDELDQLEASLQEEGALVLRVLRGALNALAQRDVELADDVISFDDDVDRMADYSVTIAKLTKLVADVEPDAMLLQSLQEMGERAEEMIRVALDALANRDLQAAES